MLKVQAPSTVRVALHSHRTSAELHAQSRAACNLRNPLPLEGLERHEVEALERRFAKVTISITGRTSSELRGPVIRRRNIQACVSPSLRGRC
jgi:hypothetical protein